MASNSGLSAIWEDDQARPCDWRGCSGLAGLLEEESVLALFECMDAKSLALLRRSTKVKSGILANEACLAELRAKTVELLESTKFPFTHAAYVLGLNGPYFSIDTLAEKHYGIPALLPRLLCRLFRLCNPHAHFTTVRIQKFAAAANFGGQHRTLAFNFANPQDEIEGESQRLAAEDADATCPVQRADANAGTVECSLPGHVICFPAGGCLGGHGEVCEEKDLGAAAAASWRVLTEPQPRARWVRFPVGAWLRWHWPRAGNLYAVTVSCETATHRSSLRRRERRQMKAIGFYLPEDAEVDQASDAEQQDGPNSAGEASPGSPSPSSQRRRPRQAHVEAALRVLGLKATPTSLQEVEETFRQLVRAAHPDRMAGSIEEPAGRETQGRVSATLASWRISQLTWARRVLREAAQFAAEADERDEVEAPPHGELLMLVPSGGDAAVPALMPPIQQDEEQGREDGADGDIVDP